MYLLHWVRVSAADALSASAELKGIAATAATRKNRRTSISFFERMPTLSHRESAAQPAHTELLQIEGRPLWPPLDDAIPLGGVFRVLRRSAEHRERGQRGAVRRHDAGRERGAVAGLDQEVLDDLLDPAVLARDAQALLQVARALALAQPAPAGGQVAVLGEVQLLGPADLPGVGDLVQRAREIAQRADGGVVLAP